MKVIIIVKTSVFDITKSIALVIAVLFLLYNANKIINTIGGNNSVKLPDEVVTELNGYGKMLQNIQTNTSGFKDLKNKLEKEDGQAAKLLEAVEEENKKRDAKLDEIGTVVGKINGTVERINVDSTDKALQPTGNVEEDARQNKLTYSKVDIKAESADGEKFPVAWAMYFPKQEDKEKKWRTGAYPLEFHETVVESQNDDGTFSRAVELHVMNNNHRDSVGIEFPVDIKSLNWKKVDKRKNSFYLWNPRLGLGMSATDTVVAPKLNISFASYGKTKIDMNWRFLTFGLGVVKDYVDSSGKEPITSKSDSLPELST